MINYKGQLYPNDEALITAENRNFKYGDGLFESMVAIEGKIPLWPLHLDRISKGMQLLGLQTPVHIDWLEEINKCLRFDSNDRIRWAVFRTDGGHYTPSRNDSAFLIQTYPLKNKPGLRLSGLKAGIFQDLPLPCGHAIWNLKTCNAIPYIMAARFAKQNNWNECLILNQNGNVAEACSSNVFIVKKRDISTPTLTEGCVAGVMRRYLIEMLNQKGIAVIEKAVSIPEVMDADEIWLTNAVKGIQWVNLLNGKEFGHEMLTEQIGEGVLPF